MKTKYDSTTFNNNFNSIISDYYGVDASSAKFIITPVFDSKRSETGEDSSFRLIIMSDNNIGGKKLDYDDTLSILKSFEPHYPTKIEISKLDDSYSSPLFEIKCSTRVRKPSEIANTGKKYAPFSIASVKE